MPVSWSCMVAFRRMAAGIALSRPRLGERQQHSQPALGFWLWCIIASPAKGQRPLAGRLQCYGFSVHDLSCGMPRGCRSPH